MNDGERQWTEHGIFVQPLTFSPVIIKRELYFDQGIELDFTRKTYRKRFKSIAYMKRTVNFRAIQRANKKRRRK